MRKRLLFAIPLAALALAAPLSALSWGSTPPKEALWTHPKTTQLASFRTPLLTTQSLAPLGVYVSAVEAAEKQALTSLAAASRTSALERSAGPTSPVITTPAAPATSGDEIPAAWQPTATCEEGGRNDPYAGYFGILEWNHFDGYPTAGSAPVNVQLDWEAAHGQAPPDAPGECHGY